MEKDTIYVGLDVHAETISVAIAEEGRTGEVRSLGRIANNPDAVSKLIKKLRQQSQTLKCCYEAGPCGYVLYRQLTKLGIECDVVAPTLIPTKSGDRVKTDRRDAEKLARCHRAGELTSVFVPTPVHEALRDLVRTRQAAKTDQTRARHRLGKFLLRHGRRPPKCRRWGSAHMKWLDEQTFEYYALEATMTDLLNEVKHVAERIIRIEQAIDHTIEQLPEADQALIQGLQALRGVAKHTAVAVFAEVGQFSRFDNPQQLMAYTGLVPSEYSTGGPNKRRPGSITKTGNSRVRWLLTESAWSYRHRPSVRGDLRKRQEGCSEEVRAISLKAQHRLHLRYRRLMPRKGGNKTVIALARELVGFMWSIGVHVEQQQTLQNGSR